MVQNKLNLPLRRQQLSRDAGGHARWESVVEERTWLAHETALLLCDVWDKHWSRGATERVDAMVPRMDHLVRVAREQGVQIVHAPSDTLGFYTGSPARRRVADASQVQVPPSMAHDDPPLPIDDSDGGSDTGEKPWYKAWSRQHPGIEIDPERDGISDSGPEIYGFMQQRGIVRLLFMGVHTNMCVLNRSFGIKQMVRWSVDVALIRDLTDTMYNPAMRPYVSHEEGTRLVVEYIEKFWCPTVDSMAVLNALGHRA